MERLLRTLARWWPVWLIAVVSPWLFEAAVNLESDTDAVIQWLPDGSSQRLRYEKFTQQFGGDNLLVVSWPGCKLDDHRVPQLADALREADTSNDSRLLRRVQTGPEMLDRLTSEPLQLTHSEAMQRLSGVYVGPDKVSTALLVELTDEGLTRQKDVIAFVRETANASCGIDRDDLKLGGNAFEAVSIDETSMRYLRSMNLGAVMIGLLIALVAVRDVRLTLAILVTAVLGEGLIVALMYYSGERLNAVAIVIPTLTYILTISGAVHLVNYYRDAAGQHGQSQAVRRMLKAGWMPCTMAAVSTAIGLVSLSVSQILPVRNFGLFAAAGLCLSLLVLLTILPALIHAWGARPQNIQASRGQASRGASKRYSHWSLTFCDAIIQRHAVVTVAALAGILVLGYGILQSKSSVKIQAMFPAESELIRNYTWLEENIGPLVAVEVIVGFDESCSLDTLEKATLVAELEQAISSVPEAGGTFSAATFTPEIPTAGGARQVIRRNAIRRALENQQDSLLHHGVLAIDDGQELWRITARVPAIHSVDYGAFADRIRRKTAPIIANHNQESGGIHVSYTGLSPLINHATKQLLVDLANSFLVAVLLICPIMMVLLRGPLRGLLSMIPNILPAAMIFGVMGWLGVALDIGAVLTASVALGIAVDDTFHFLTWFQRGLDAGMSRRDAVRDAYARCAPAMLQTTLICGCGLLIYFISGFIPTSRFAVLMAALLTSALVADLIVLPAMLAGPLGAIFGGTGRRGRLRRIVAPLPRMARRWRKLALSRVRLG